MTLKSKLRQVYADDTCFPSTRWSALIEMYEQHVVARNGPKNAQDTRVKFFISHQFTCSVQHDYRRRVKRHIKNSTIIIPCIWIFTTCKPLARENIFHHDWIFVTMPLTRAYYKHCPEAFIKMHSKSCRLKIFRVLKAA